MPSKSTSHGCRFEFDAFRYFSNMLGTPYRVISFRRGTMICLEKILISLREKMQPYKSTFPSLKVLPYQKDTCMWQRHIHLNSQYS